MGLAPVQEGVYPGDEGIKPAGPPSEPPPLQAMRKKYISINEGSKVRPVRRVILNLRVKVFPLSAGLSSAAWQKSDRPRPCR